MDTPLRHKPLSLVLAIFLASCTAGSQRSVISKFPSTIEIEEFLFFKTDYLDCTFAEVATSPASFISEDDLKQTQDNLQRLKYHQSQDPRATFKFPERGFAYFREQSIVDVAGDMDIAGDPSLGYNIGEEIFSAKSCWKGLIDKRDRERRERYANLISAAEGTVIIGSEYPHTAIIFFPKQNRAYYFGP